MSSQPPQLTDLMSQVDRLEQEVKDLAREVERKERQAVCLEEKITRDMEKEERLLKEIRNISSVSLELEDRERFLAGAIQSTFQDLKVLQQMEAEGKTKLCQEIKKTDDLFVSLKRKLDVFQSKYIEDIKMLEQLPVYAEEKEIEEKMEKLAKIEEENQELEEEIEERRTRKKKEWESLERSCIFLAGKGLEAKEKFRKLEALKSSESKSHEEESAVRVVELDDTLDVTETATEPSKPLNTETPETSSDSDPSSNEARGEIYEENHAILIESIQDSTSGVPQPTSTLAPEEVAEPNLKVSTPKSKSFLGSSFITSLKKGFSSPKKEKKVQSLDVEVQEALEEVSGCSEPRVKDSLFPTPAQRPKLKSFKLGLPSFLLKKKVQDITKLRADTDTETGEEASEVLKSRTLSSNRGESPVDISSGLQPRLELSLPEPTGSRRSLDQLHGSGDLLSSQNVHSTRLTLPAPRRETSLQSLSQPSALSSKKPAAALTLPALNSLLLQNKKPEVTSKQKSEVSGEQVVIPKVSSPLADTNLEDVEESDWLANFGDSSSDDGEERGDIGNNDGEESGDIKNDDGFFSFGGNDDGFFSCGGGEEEEEDGSFNLF